MNEGTVKRRKGGRTLSPRAQSVWSIVQLLIGSMIVAISFNMFMVPNGIASGGVSGVSILVQRMAGITPALTQWAINIPLFIVGLWLLGKRFGLKTALGSVILPLFVLLTNGWPSPTDNPLLAAIYGGIGVGLGLGLVFRGGASTGGLDLAAQILHRYTGLPLSLAIVCFDGCVIIAAGIIISPEVALYALIGLFVTSKTIDFVQSGLQLSKVAFIISEESESVAEAILHDLDRGLTRLDGHGGYTGAGRTVLMVVVGQNEVPKLKQLVRAIDPGAFVIISNTAEVLGQGFKLDS
ncbi:hypothetical protein BK133_10240 [Paenibacillus sp. FSL H8-0548]|uniref:YitT family protein n=1 Tax=Paenibacillus sp. FSL H8-0548 TaxID=1920422 RepID=UPI00096E8DD9|nr:YitT family protein [Paenibacillus sp. FSL H8-0548]OMF35821.1 hypothetical protein BK133_10240 [Paenibacillus sp. FSL H8-0548]